jgi:hypothetical protein
VNIPSGEPEKHQTVGISCEGYGDLGPADVNCLYSVINRLRAVALLEPLEFISDAMGVKRYWLWIDPNAVTPQ